MNGPQTMPSLRPCCRTLAVALVGALVAAQAVAEEYAPGQTYFGQKQYIEYLAGNLPFILSAPHGGREKPEEIPDRKEGTFAYDANTQELARTIAAEFTPAPAAGRT
jgi:hypothetical protein